MKKLLLGILAMSMFCTACKKDKEDESGIDKSQIVGNWKVTNVTSAITLNGIAIPTTLFDVDELVSTFVEKDQVFEFKDNGDLKVDIGGGDYNQFTYKTEGKYIVVSDPAHPSGSFKYAASVNGSVLTLTLEQADIQALVAGYIQYLENLPVTIETGKVGGKIDITLTKQ
ncbi:MAG: hypothetical protein LBD59_11910 [Prevotellaceae bacterium]|jgi:hypothetical protein|nr:hypothetical protein [Prevotellaceae bacterium]